MLKKTKRVHLDGEKKHPHFHKKFCTNQKNGNHVKICFFSKTLSPKLKHFYFIVYQRKLQNKFSCFPGCFLCNPKLPPSLLQNGKYKNRLKRFLNFKFQLFCNVKNLLQIPTKLEVKNQKMFLYFSKASNLAKQRSFNIHTKFNFKMHLLISKLCQQSLPPI